MAGPLVSMLIKISQDIFSFLIILCAILLGFSQAFWLLSHGATTELFDTIQNSYMFTYMYMLGKILFIYNDYFLLVILQFYYYIIHIGMADPTSFDDSHLPYLCYFFLAVFLLFVMILMLNLLIALMSDSYGEVRERGKAQWRFEQAKIIVEVFHKFHSILLLII